MIIGKGECGSIGIFMDGPNDQRFKDCFVFKWKEAGSHHRLYGFLFNPKPLTDSGYQVCVLAFHTRKNKENTDPAILDKAVRLRENIEVIRAIKKEFPEI